MMKNLVYFGSPDFSGQILESIITSKLVNVVGVVTPPDKPQGRKQILTPAPVSLTAQKYNLPVYQPNRLDDDNLTHIRLLKPDIFLVVSYGKIIPKVWLEIPTIGTFNIHFSLLPKYRGALCISEAIKNQDRETGATLMVMDEQMDHGPVIDQQKINIENTDDVSTLTTKLTQVASKILVHKLPEICAQNFSSTTQDESRATFTSSHRTVSRQSAFIPWETIQLALTTNDQELATKTHALIRSLNPEPGAWTTISSPVGAHHDAPEAAGTSMFEMKILQTTLSSGKLIIDTVQIPGKNPISWKQFLSGHQLRH